MKAVIVLIVLVTCLSGHTGATTAEEKARVKEQKADVKARLNAYKDGINNLAVGRTIADFNQLLSVLNLKVMFNSPLKSLLNKFDDPNFKIDIYKAGLVPDLNKRKKIEQSCERYVSQVIEVEEQTNFDQSISEEVRKKLDSPWVFSRSLMKLEQRLGYFEACRRFLNHLLQTTGSD